ncbi:MAG: prkC 23 [Gemmataceae bacterium]|nr:prkC 23 [Gemmataceae bacterium]
MSDPRSDDLELVSALRAGSESAARELFDKYCEQLMKLARRRIGQKMTSRVDPEDVLQSAFRSFFVRVKNDEFSFEAEDDLFKLLVRITVHKTLRQIAFHRAAKRDPARETGQGRVGEDVLGFIASADPPAEVEVALIDEFEKFVAQLPPLDRQVLELRFQGYTPVEIAETLGTYDRKVRRILERVQATAEAGLPGG